MSEVGPPGSYIINIALDTKALLWIVHENEMRFYASVEGLLRKLIQTAYTLAS
jgi:hypothetical protein